MASVIYMALNKLAAPVWRYRAYRARQQGRYTLQTCTYFYKAWQYSGAISDLLALALFRRELGLPLSRRCWQKLYGELEQLSFKQQQQACGLLIEKPVAALDELKSSESLCMHAEQLQMPALLSVLAADTALTPYQQSLLTVQQRQMQWRLSFAQQVKTWVHAHGICVVGNAAGMHGACLGQSIDQHSAVVRFNTYADPKLAYEDVGQCINVWGLTPSYKLERNATVCGSYMVLTGPDIRYKLLNWQGLYGAVTSGLIVLTIPLSVWRRLVKLLQAPPSAGLALLAWLHELNGSWRGISVAGFGALCPAVDYHAVHRQQAPSSRHNWIAEAQLLQRWVRQGLRNLHD